MLWILTNILRLITICVYFVALVMLRSALKNNNIDMNLKALAIHCLAFLSLAAEVIYATVVGFKAISNPSRSAILNFVYSIDVGIVLDCIGGCILAYIVLKIY